MQRWNKSRKTYNKTQQRNYGFELTRKPYISIRAELEKEVVF
jgi:hypothetical protein